MANNSASNDLVSFNSFKFNHGQTKNVFAVMGIWTPYLLNGEFKTTKRIKESRKKKSYQTYWRYLVLFSCLPQIFQTILLWWKPGKDKTISQKYHQTEETLETLFFTLVDNRTSCPTNTGLANPPHIVQNAIWLKKIEPVTIKANFIHFWSVESEFIVKNELHNWTSELGCVWHIFGEFGSFQVLQHW